MSAAYDQYIRKYTEFLTSTTVKIATIIIITTTITTTHCSGDCGGDGNNRAWI